jgi:hypothetical protein
MQQSWGSRSGALVVGTLLIVIGIGAIVVRQYTIDLPWPAWVILPGIVLFLAAFALPVPAGSGLAVAGAIVTMVGVVLAVQDATDTYASWAYAWALVAPGGAGIGLLLYAIPTRRGELARDGLGTLAVGVVMFLVGFVFFEGVIHLDGDRFGNLTTAAVPVVIVALGVLVILGALIPGPWRSRHARFDAGWSSPRGPSGPDGWSAAASTRGAGSGARSVAEVVDVPLAGATDAEVRISFGAGRLAVGVAQPGKLLDGTCTGGAEVSNPAPGRVRVSTPRSAWNWTLNRPPFEWRVGLTGEIPLRLEVETGAADSELDLAMLRVSDLRIRTGASQTRVVLPAAAGLTRVSAESGAAQLRFRVPDGVAARIRSTMALGSTDVDSTRFPRTPDGQGWASPDFDAAANRVELEVRGGAGQVTVS